NFRSFFHEVFPTSVTKHFPDCFRKIRICSHIGNHLSHFIALRTFTFSLTLFLVFTFTLTFSLALLLTITVTILITFLTLTLTLLFLTLCSHFSIILISFC